MRGPIDVAEPAFWIMHERHPRLLAALLLACGVIVGSAGTYALITDIENGLARSSTSNVGTPNQRRLDMEHTLSGSARHHPDREPRSSSNVGSARHRADIFDGIHGVLREWGCGHGNMQTPKTILVGGFGEVIVDVGLGTDAKETLDAVSNGFVVIAFEPMPSNMASIRSAVSARRMDTRVQFVSLSRDAQRGWRMPELTPRAGSAGRHNGFAYIIHAAVGAEGATLMLPSSMQGHGAMGSIATSKGLAASPGLMAVPQVALDDVLPAWAKTIHLLKIDTQGYELRVLKGALASLRADRFRYVLYEFSPWLMTQGSLGEPRELLRLLPDMKAICFDMMGLHNMFPHTQQPLESYYAELLRGSNSYMHGNQMPASGVVPGTGVGPWDDIMCWFPAARPRVAPLDQGGDFGFKKYNEPGSFGARFLEKQNPPQAQRRKYPGFVSG